MTNSTEIEKILKKRKKWTLYSPFDIPAFVVLAVDNLHYLYM